MKDAQSYMSFYYSKRFIGNVLSHLRQLSIFCVSFNQVFLSANKETLLGFIALMSRSCGYEHIEHILNFGDEADNFVPVSKYGIFRTLLRVTS